MTSEKLCVLCGVNRILFQTEMCYHGNTIQKTHNQHLQQILIMNDELCYHGNTIQMTHNQLLQ